MHNTILSQKSLMRKVLSAISAVHVKKQSLGASRWTENKNYCKSLVTFSVMLETII